jgi:hypothetical protein
MVAQFQHEADMQERQLEAKSNQEETAGTTLQ